MHKLWRPKGHHFSCHTRTPSVPSRKYVHIVASLARITRRNRIFRVPEGCARALAHEGLTANSATLADDWKQTFRAVRWSAPGDNSRSRTPKLLLRIARI